MGQGYAPIRMRYLYRDWVVRAFNDDLPYDQFIQAQLAADKMDEAAGENASHSASSGQGPGS